MAVFWLKLAIWEKLNRKRNGNRMNKKISVQNPALALFLALISGVRRLV
jgi:hypothetical protein